MDAIPLIQRPRSLDAAWRVFGQMVERARAWAHEDGLTKEEREERWETVKRLQKAQDKIEEMDERARRKARREAK